MSITESAHISVFKKEVLSKFLFVVDQKTFSLKILKNSFTNFKAGFEKLRSYKSTKQNQTIKGIHKKFLSKPLLIVGQKKSFKKHKNSFKFYRA